MQQFVSGSKTAVLWGAASRVFRIVVPVRVPSTDQIELLVVIIRIHYLKPYS